jgi:hypothetical protein
MKKVVLSIIFAVLVTLAPSVKASVISNKSFSVNLPDGGDKKKKKDKNCESKKGCSSSSKKGCCSSSKSEKTEETK